MLCSKMLLLSFVQGTRRTFLEMSGEASTPTTQNQTRRRYYRESR